jgi:hypothetical protein
MNSEIEKARQSREALQACRSLNKKLTATQQVPPSSLTTYVNLATGGVGMKGLIRDILKGNGSVWLSVISSPAERTDAIAASMYTEDIHDQVRIRFTAQTTRYPAQSVSNCLVEMRKDRDIGKIELTTEEDPFRRCKRPRCKWYWARA